jgi:lysophospholipase L1-like esterase
MERYPRSVRWTGQLQSHLGDNYYVIEEGLNGRTTNIEYPDIPGGSGTSYILSCLYSHSPLSLVVLQLGLNDLKTFFKRTAEDVSEGLVELVDMIQASPCGVDMQSPPSILIVAPPLPSNEDFIDTEGERVFVGSIAKAKMLAPLYNKIADAKGCEFLDLSQLVTLSTIDGIHFDESGHNVVAAELKNKIQSLF